MQIAFLCTSEFGRTDSKFNIFAHSLVNVRLHRLLLLNIHIRDCDIVLSIWMSIFWIEYQEQTINTTACPIQTHTIVKTMNLRHVSVYEWATLKNKIHKCVFLAQRKPKIIITEAIIITTIIINARERVCRWVSWKKIRAIAWLFQTIVRTRAGREGQAKQRYFWK